MIRGANRTGQVPRPFWILICLLLITFQAFALTLKETTTVEGDKIYLNDLLCSEDEGRPWGEIEVLSAPLPGTQRAIYKSLIVTILRKNGFIDEAGRLDGPNYILVTRLIEDQDSDQKKPASQDKDATPDAIWDFSAFEERIVLNLAGRLSEIIPGGFTPNVEITHPARFELTEEPLDLILDIGALRNSYWGNAVVPLDFILSEGKTRRILLSVRITYTGEVLISAGDLRSKDGITEENTQIAVRTFVANPNECFFPVTEIERYQVKSYVKSGDILFKKAVELKPVKKSGEMTRLYLHRSGIRIEVSVELLEDAVPGNPARAKNISSGKILTGIVQDDGTLIFQS